MIILSRPHFIFPSDPLDFSKADQELQDQINCLRKAGFSVSYYSIDAHKLYYPKAILPNSVIVYRGWMMTLSQYKEFSDLINSLGHDLLVNPDEYALCHHLPNWNYKIPEMTAPTAIFSEQDDLVAELTKLGWDKFFIKDYVKSLKTAPGSIISKPEEITAVVAAMKKYRGFIEGGICVRQYEEYKPNSETRVFVLKGRAYEPGTLVPDAVYDIVKECIKRIDSPFFTIDIALRTDNTYRVIEIGDGQVSDLVDPWKPGQLAGMFVKDATR